MNIARGIRKAILFGILGFLIPVVVIGGISVCVFVFTDIHPTDRQQDIERLPSTILYPAIGCSIGFALAAFASYTPHHGIKFLRSLLIVASFAVVALLLAQPHERNKVPDPNAWIETAVPLIAAVVACGIIFGLGLQWHESQEHID